MQRNIIGKFIVLFLHFARFLLELMIKTSGAYQLSKGFTENVFFMILYLLEKGEIAFLQTYESFQTYQIGFFNAKQFILLSVGNFFLVSPF